MDLGMENQTCPATDDLGGSLIRREPLPEAGSLNVSAREGAFPSVVARQRQRPGLQRQSLYESFSKLQKNSENRTENSTTPFLTQIHQAPPTMHIEVPLSKHRDSKLQTYCLLNPKSFSVCFPRTRTFCYTTAGELSRSCNVMVMQDCYVLCKILFKY